MGSNLPERAGVASRNERSGKYTIAKITFMMSNLIRFVERRIMNQIFENVVT